MKIKSLLCVLITTFTISISHCQSLKTDWVKKHIPLKLTPYKALPSGAVAQPATSGTILLLTPSIPFSGATLVKQNGNWSVNGQVSSGLTYNFIIGNGTTNPDNSITVIPYFSLGAYFSTGAIQSGNSVVSTFAVGGDIGVYKYVNIFGDYDVVNKSPQIGIGAIVSLISFTQGPGSVILKYQ